MQPLIYYCLIRNTVYYFVLEQKYLVVVFCLSVLPLSAVRAAG